MKRFMLIISLVIVIVLSVAALIFALQNTGTAQVHFISWNAEGSLAVIVIVAYLAGAVTGALLLLPGSVKNAAQLALARRKLDNIAKTADTGKPAADKPAADKLADPFEDKSE